MGWDRTIGTNLGESFNNIFRDIWTETTNPLLHLLEHFLLNTRATCIEIRVVECLKNLTKLLEPSLYECKATYPVYNLVRVRVFVEPRLEDVNIGQKATFMMGETATYVDDEFNGIANNYKCSFACWLV